MILRLRTNKKELSITREEGEKITMQLAEGVEMILFRGWTIMRGDIAHIDPTGLSRDEITELDKRALPTPAIQRASPETVDRVRQGLIERGFPIKPKKEGGI